MENLTSERITLKLVKISQEELAQEQGLFLTLEVPKGFSQKGSSHEGFSQALYVEIIDQLLLNNGVAIQMLLNKGSAIQLLLNKGSRKASR